MNQIIIAIGRNKTNLYSLRFSWKDSLKASQVNCQVVSNLLNAKLWKVKKSAIFLRMIQLTHEAFLKNNLSGR